MEPSDAIDEIKKALSEVQAKGEEFVNIKSLVAFLESLKKDASVSSEIRNLQHQSNLEYYKAQNQFELEKFRAQCLSNTEMFKSVIQAGQNALKTSFLINGGAAVALLAFIGNIWSKVQSSKVVEILISALIIFCGGVLLGAIATGLNYLCQALYEKKWVKSGNILNILSISVVIGTYLCFIAGIWFIRKSFLMHLIQQ